MRQRTVDYDIVDTLAMAFRCINLGVQHQSPKIRVHSPTLVTLSIPFRLYRVRIRHTDLKTCAAGQEEKANARSSTPGAKFFSCARRSHACGSHYRSPYRIIFGAFGLGTLVVAVWLCCFAISPFTV